MRSALILASASAVAASAIGRHVYPISNRNSSDPIKITLEAQGAPVSGYIGQIADGQNRIGGSLPVAQFLFGYGPKGGEITDKNGRGCILTPPTKQFQCDEGVGRKSFPLVAAQYAHLRVRYALTIIKQRQALLSAAKGFCYTMEPRSFGPVL
ncbi:hypothetical protein N0V90_004396 [Kalmusia sp. IMI 367209]|nr:hypothetical protein N0V90_004396 [Kalmusia sp. IMI 367209]